MLVNVYFVPPLQTSGELKGKSREPGFQMSSKECNPKLMCRQAKYTHTHTHTAENIT